MWSGRHAISGGAKPNVSACSRWGLGLCRPRAGFRRQASWWGCGGMLGILVLRWAAAEPAPVIPIEAYRPSLKETLAPDPLAATFPTSSFIAVGPPAPVAVSAPTPAAGSGSAVETPGNEKVRRVRSNALAVTFGGLAVGCLAASIGLTVANPIWVHRSGCGDRFLNDGCTVALDMQPLYIGGYVESGVMTLATILTLVFR
jgi:hypothetical protein